MTGRTTRASKSVPRARVVRQRIERPTGTRQAAEVNELSEMEAEEAGMSSALTQRTHVRMAAMAVAVSPETAAVYVTSTTKM